MKISDINLKIISDSRGNDTLEVEMESVGVKVLSSVPSGKSTGKGEVIVLSPHEALQKVDWIFSQIKDHDFASIEQFDQLLITLDGTEDKSRLGGNLILVLSIAFTKLLAKQGGMEIWQLISKISGNQIGRPLCFFNLIEGGLHAQNSLPFQEYLFIPQTSSAKESLEEVMMVIKVLGDKIQGKYEHLKQGDEGGYTISSSDPKMGLEMLQEVQNEMGGENWLGLDVAASTFFKDGKYNIGDKVISTQELLSYYNQLIANYKLLSIEDPFAEDDWEGFSKITNQFGEKIWIVGDDLTTTNTSKIKLAGEKKAANAVIIKPNQIGSVSQTLQAVNLAKSLGWKIIVSHRSGETMDSFIADLAVGVGADGFKSGCPLQKERLVKYQRLIEIENG